MNEPEKIILDVAAGSVTFATVVGWLPAAAAAITIIYTAVRLWESATCRRLFRALCTRCEAWWWGNQ